MSYGTAVATGGAAPVTVFCSPESGSTFNPGPTTVTCTATDAKNTAKTCSLIVTVTVPAQLSLTKFAAFGDSITAGEVIAEGNAFGLRILKVDKTLAYPHDLFNLLASRYTAQLGQLNVSNDGVSGEGTLCGVYRLMNISNPRCTLDSSPATTQQVLLLMEGANDISDDPASIEPAAENIDKMVVFAKNRGMRVLLASIPPHGPATSPCYDDEPARNGGLLNVPIYNDRLRQIASSQGVAFVDVYADLIGNLPGYIDCDGLHPTVAGYQRIAQTFYNAITETLEVKSLARPTSYAVQPVQRPARLRR